MASVCFNPEKITNLNDYLKAPGVPAHKKIGSVYSRINEASSGEPARIPNYLAHLGIDMDDKTAVQAMSSLVQTLSDGSLRIVPSDDTGIYFLKKPSKQDKDIFEDVAVFKIGRKRAAIEMMARQLAHHLGLNKQMLPGIFCAIADLPVGGEKDADCEVIEELWNGNEKAFSSPPKKNVQFIDGLEINIDKSSVIFEEESTAEKTASAVVGIVQPFLKKETDAALYDYTLMTIFALAIGLRDGKKNSYEGSTIFDVEDCMPVRIDPPWDSEKLEEVPSAIDLPYLDKDPRTDQNLSMEDVENLAHLVQQWNISSIITKLERLKIRFEDLEAEQLSEKSSGYDEGGNYIEIEKGKPHLINGHLSHLESFNTKRRILLPRQLDACNTRLQRIRDYVQCCVRSKKSFSPQKLVYAVDLYGKVYHEALRSGSSNLSKQDGRKLSDSGPNSISGRRSPKDLNISLPLLENFPSSSAIIDKLKEAATRKQETAEKN